MHTSDINMFMNMTVKQKMLKIHFVTQNLLYLNIIDVEPVQSFTAKYRNRAILYFSKPLDVHI